MKHTLIVSQQGLQFDENQTMLFPDVIPGKRTPGGVDKPVAHKPTRNILPAEISNFTSLD